MKGMLIVGGVLGLAILIAVFYLRHGGVTHESVYRAVVDGAADVKERIDDRYEALDRKLDRIEGKLDRILEIANRPMPDNLQTAK